MSKAKQGHLDGLAPPTIAEVDAAADTYYELNSKSWKLREKVAEAKDALLEVMKANDLTVYRYDDKEITVVDRETVKVKKLRGEENGDE